MTLGSGALTIHHNAGHDGIFAGEISGSGSIAKSGPATLRLTQAQTFTGLTTVAAGTLVVNGSTPATCPVTVAGGVMGGTGTVAGSVTVTSQGTVAPGDAIGVLSVGSADFLSGATLAVGIDDSSNSKCDLLVANGALKLTGAKLNISVAGNLGQTSYLIATGNPIIGAIAPENITGLPSGYSLQQSASEIRLVAETSVFQSWMTNQFPSVIAPDNAPDADADGDSVSNFHEFALAGDPSDATTHALTRKGIETVGGSDHFTYTFACRSSDPFSGTAPATGAADGVAYSVRASSSLQDFALGVAEVIPALTNGLPAAPSGFTYRTFRITTPVDITPKGFIQITTTPASL